MLFVEQTCDCSTIQATITNNPNLRRLQTKSRSRITTRSDRTIAIARTAITNYIRPLRAVLVIYLFLGFSHNTFRSVTSWKQTTSTTIASTFIFHNNRIANNNNVSLWKKRTEKKKTKSILLQATTTASTTTSTSSSSTVNDSNSAENNSEILTSSSSTFDNQSSTQPSNMKDPTTKQLQLPNWRSIPNPREYDNSDDIEKQNHYYNEMRILLSQRTEWSEQIYEKYCALYDKFMSCDDSYVADYIRSAIITLDHAYRLYNGPDSVLCSFNGGKDAVVILQLGLASAANYYRTNPSVRRNRPRVVYFEHRHEFPEIQEFLQTTVHELDLEMIAFEEGTKFPDGLRLLVNHNIPSSLRNIILPHSNTNATTTATDGSDIDDRLMTIPSWPIAFVLGTRSGDPNAGNQEQFAPSSLYMPQFMRVNPILRWTYGHVWHFLRLYQLPYCTLYDQGYTSLGTIHDTIPCPALAVPGRTGATTNDPSSSASIPKYWPAYMLRDWDQERAGRIPKNKGDERKTTTTASPKKGSIVARRKVTSIPEVVDLTDTTDHSLGGTSSTGRLSTMTDGRFIITTAPPHPVGTIESRTVLPPSNVDGIVTSNILQDEVINASELNLNNQNDTNYANYRTLDTGDDDNAVSYSEDESTKSVALLVIGDEILKGYTGDLNTKVAATALRDNNVFLQRVVFVSDDLEDIRNEIISLQQQVDVIITSGGVGPTHDDVTIKSVAAALDCDMMLHDEMAQLLLSKMNPPKSNVSSPLSELSEGQKKMAMLPRHAKLRYLSNNTNDWPVLQCRNIFILPGIPEYFAQKVQNVARYLSCQLERSSAYKVVLSVEESLIVTILNDIVAKHPGVIIGSYPFVSHPDYKTVITVEGKIAYPPAIPQSASNSNMSTAFIRNSDVFERRLLTNKSAKEIDDMVQFALDDLINALPPNSVLRVDNTDMTLFS